MKRTLKLTSTLLLASLLFTNIHANEEEPREELSIEQQEKIEVRNAERAERREAKLERKKELIRTRMEARGIPYDEIESHIERVFSRLESEAV